MADKKSEKFDCLGVQVSAIDAKDACEKIEDAITQNKKTYICVCPVSTIMECVRDKKVLNIVNSATMVTPDGMPIVWLGKISGHRNIKRVYGPDLLLEICGLSQKKGYKNYFYGSTPQVLEKLQMKLSESFPGLNISGAYSPPFKKLTEDEDGKITEILNKSNSDILWVGLGSPKQDIWMYEHRDKINTPVMIGVGAAFDFISGMKKQAPRWMQKTGLEWLFRLTTEPKRLWKRYLLGNPLFLYLLLRKSMLKVFFKKVDG